MDLVQQVVANLKVEPGQAEKGIGAILMSMRMAVDKATFEKVTHISGSVPCAAQLCRSTLCRLA